MSAATHSDSTADTITAAAPQASIDFPGTVRYYRDRHWQNWGQTARCRPAFTFYPHTLEKLIQIVHFAREHGRHLRAVGSGHSWSALVPTGAGACRHHTTGTSACRSPVRSRQDGGASLCSGVQRLAFKD